MGNTYASVSFEKDNTALTDIHEIEQRLSTIIRSDGNGWKEAYILLEKVEDEELWRDAGATSFTSWLVSFSSREGLSHHTLWKAKAAGRAYRKYENYSRQCGENPDSLFDTSIQEDALINLDRMAMGNASDRVSLINYALKHKVTTKTAISAWQTMRRQIEKRGETEAARCNSYSPYASIPEGISSIDILSRAAYPQSSDSALSDREILYLVHKYLGARVSRSALEHALSDYAEML